MNNANVAGHRQSATDPTAQVFLAYAAEDGCRAPGEAIAGPGGAEVVGELRQLLTQTQITYRQCPCPWPADADPEAIISRAAEACDNYVLVLSPYTLADVFCLQGLLFALSLNKRIVPVLIETVSAHHLPEPLQTLETVDLRDRSLPLTQTDGGRQLLQILHHAADYHHAHTQLLLRALEWERQRRHPDLLLEGDELDQYQRWLVQANGRSHHRPIQLQALYITESARHQASQGSAVALGMGWIRRWL
ncbi:MULTISPECIES: toll/interleukin-1 receptor domain-containing protein [Cyanophyceae]|uniref:Toll/interleukin-1 receptor domain-containing protein n=1 Tax=Leptolyngbya subtilissima DQ-A4 TaxID=2933933 RepID=A0ABV0K114_9CYAN|nr:toll/interleukin-1 receptor domain-containing protein [Nodosilinea sp. FACHB-141]MBD2111183.1 toll/interleukin-1 receptor domain-containing protein [Nodosilinea sp. FACHB-141]